MRENVLHGGGLENRFYSEMIDAALLGLHASCPLSSVQITPLQLKLSFLSRTSANPATIRIDKNESHVACPARGGLPVISTESHRSREMSDYMAASGSKSFCGGSTPF